MGSRMREPQFLHSIGFACDSSSLKRELRDIKSHERGVFSLTRVKPKATFLDPGSFPFRPFRVESKAQVVRRCASSPGNRIVSNTTLATEDIASSALPFSIWFSSIGRHRAPLHITGDWNLRGYP